VSEKGKTMRPFLTRPAEIDWLQRGEFEKSMLEPDYPQLTLSLIAEYKEAVEKLEAENKRLREELDKQKERKKGNE
jgi:Zn-finger nucleic acid-binding protein